ncbi:hypothetical protein WI97_13145 [Burkholderia vietnamiensis]|nr:hypothetical protein WI97_13145 [Burkholderia vietnamiensis]
MRGRPARATCGIRHRRSRIGHASERQCLSRALRVASAARRNSTFASSARPSVASSSPRTLGSQ